MTLELIVALREAAASSRRRVLLTSHPVLSFLNKPRSADATALEPCEVLVLRQRGVPLAVRSGAAQSCSTGRPTSPVWWIPNTTLAPTFT